MVASRRGERQAAKHKARRVKQRPVALPSIDDTPLEAPALEPPPADPRAPGRRVIARTEAWRRLEYLKMLMARETSNRAIYEQMRDRWHINTQSVRKLMMQVEYEWDERGMARKVEREKERHIDRLMSFQRLAMSATRRDPATGQQVPDPQKFVWPAVMKAEELVGKIAGTFAPVEVRHSGQMNAALVAVIAEMDDAERERLVTEQLELERKAAERDRLVVQDRPALTLVPRKAGA
jgi:hypothetical protein